MICNDIIEKYINFSSVIIEDDSNCYFSWDWKNILCIKEIIGPIVKTDMLFSAFIN